MKFFKNILCIAALFAIGSVNARQVGGKTTSTSYAPAKRVAAQPASPAKKTIAPAAANKSFQSLLTHVRTIKNPKEVINNDGTFNDKFINLVTSSNLHPELTKALLQAGRNLHLQLSGDDEQDDKAIESAGEEIKRIMNAIMIPQQEEIVLAPQPELSPENFLKEKINRFANMFKKDLFSDPLSPNTFLPGETSQAGHIISSLDKQLRIYPDLSPQDRIKLIEDGILNVLGRRPQCKNKQEFQDFLAKNVGPRQL